MSTTSEFILRAPGATIREVVDADGLIEAEDLALAWGEENGHVRVEIFDAESHGASALAEVVAPAAVRARWPRAFDAAQMMAARQICAAHPGYDAPLVARLSAKYAAETVLAAEDRGASDAAHSIRQSEADGEWLDDDAARDGAREDLSQTDARDLVRDEDGDVVADLEAVYVTAWVDAYRAGRGA